MGARDPGRAAAAADPHPIGVMPAQRDSASLGTVTSGTVTRRLILCALLIGVVALIAGCGSSKPAFCKDKNDLQKSVSSISVSGGVSSLKTQLQTIETQAKSLVSSAKSDFPDQTTAINTAVSKLQTDIKALPSSPTPAQLASVALSAKDTVTSVSAFASAAKDKC
jgi:hypothetical protein